ATLFKASRNGASVSLGGTLPTADAPAVLPRPREPSPHHAVARDRKPRTTSVRAPRLRWRTRALLRRRAAPPAAAPRARELRHCESPRRGDESLLALLHRGTSG